MRRFGRHGCSVQLGCLVKRTIFLQEYKNTLLMVSSISLALISRRYELAYQTLKFVSHQNLNEDDLSEFDRLVQLIESPGFTLLRFELLQRPPVLIG